MHSKSIARAVKFFIYATFFVPLLVLPTSFIFPFIVPKILLFRSLTVLIMVGYALLLVTKNQEYKPRFTPLSVAVVSFLVSFTLSTFIGVDSYHSFWDNHERMLGLFTIFHYVAYFFVCSHVFKSWTEWKWALRVFLLAGSVVMVLGCMQVVDPNFLLNGGSARVISTLGNAIYVGGYSLFLLFVALLLFIKDNNIVWRWAEVLAAIFASMGLFFSGTRGSIIGLMVGLFCAGIAYIVVSKETPKVRNTLILILSAGILVLGTLIVFRDTKFVEDIPALNRVLHTSLSELTGGSARSIAWKVAFESWKERPIFGWGPNNFFYAFNKYYDPESLKYGYGETWFDNAHNIIVNTMAVQGIVGICTYLAIFIVGVWSLFRMLRLGKIDKHIAIIGSAFLVAHLTQNVSVFENPTSYLYFMFWLALVNSSVMHSTVVPTAPETNKKSSAQISTERPVSLGYLVVGGVCAVVFIFVLNVQPAKANMKALQALMQASGDPVGAIPTIEDALAFSSPHIDDIRNDISHAVIAAVGDTNRKIAAADKQKLVKIVDDSLRSNIELHPFDIRVYLSLSQMYQSIAIETNNVILMQQAEQYLVTALSYSPHRQQIIYNLAIVKAMLNKGDEAVKLFDQAINDNPKIAESYIRLAYLYLNMEKMDKAKETIERANTAGVVYTAAEQQSVNQIIAAFMAPQVKTITPSKKK